MGYKHQHLGWQPGMAVFFIDKTMHPEVWHKHIAIYSAGFTKSFVVASLMSDSQGLTSLCQKSAMKANLAIEKAKHTSRSL